jgi:hypothetical protein
MTSLILLSALACTGETEDTGTELVTEPTHPNVPDGYEYKWSTGTCTQGDGSEGSNVYMLGEGYASDDGTVEITETWYWFFGGDWEDDCVEPWIYEGEIAGRSPASFGAGEAESMLETTMSLPDPVCNILYYGIFDQEKTDYEEQAWKAWVILEYLSSWGNPNEQMQVFMVYGEDGDSVDYSYANGEFLPDDPDVYDLPAHFTWEAHACIGSG